MTQFDPTGWVETTNGSHGFFWIILGSDDSFCQDLLQLLDGSNRWRQHTEVWKDFLMNMFLANAKKVACGLCAWIRKEEGSLFEAGGIYKTLAYLSSEGTKFLFIIPFTRTIWTKGKSFRTPGETYINVQKPENASQGSPSFGVPLRFSSMISF